MKSKKNIMPIIFAFIALCSFVFYAIAYVYAAMYEIEHDCCYSKFS